jgi:hypothetical protein
MGPELQYFGARWFIEVFHNRLGTDWRPVYSMTRFKEDWPDARSGARIRSLTDNFPRYEFLLYANEEARMDNQGRYHVFDTTYVPPPLDYQI